MEEIITNRSFDYDTTAIYTKIVECAKKGENTTITAEGLLQVLVFYMDCYTIHSDPRILEQVHGLMEYYHKKVEQNDGDYSVVTGKLGFLYAATRLYEIEKSSIFLERAKAFLTEGFSNFIKSPYTNNSIFTGRSGCLLVLNYYYTLTKDTQAPKWMDLLAQKIIGQAQLSDKGIYWNDPFEKLKGVLDFEKGNAGIGYLFLMLGDFYQQEEFQALAKQIYSHQSQYWDAQLGWKKSKKGIQDLSSYQHAIKAIQEENPAFFEASYQDLSLHLGITKFALQLWKKGQEDSLKAEVITYLNASKELFLNSNLSKEAIVRRGSLFIEAARILQDPTYLQEAQRMANFLDQPSSKTDDPFATAVLEARIAHFYLALENPLLDCSLFSKCTPQGDHQALSSPIRIKESLLQNTFGRTLSLLKSIDSTFIEDYLKQSIQEKTVFNFMRFIKKNANQFPAIPKKQLSEILKLEITRYNLKKGIQNYAHLEAKDIYRYQSVQALFNTTDEELGTTVLQINAKAKMISTAWNWELRQGSVPAKNLLDSESKFKVFLFPHYKSLVLEYWQNPHNVVLNYFENQKSIAQAISQIKQFYLAKDEIYMDKFSQFIMAEKEYVLANLDSIILNRIKEYMGMGLLEMVK